LIHDRQEHSLHELGTAYKNADFIMSISEDTSKMIPLAFPFIGQDKIIRMCYSVAACFSNISPKRKVITYMPRKLSGHSERVCFYLQPYLPDNWKLSPIIDCNETEVASALAQSSIFMSFSELEGLPLPPLEAAISENIVVGYTGEGGKEYFCQPMFREIMNGDLRTYVHYVRAAIKDVEDGAACSTEFLDQVTKLKETYSKENELSYLLRFARRAAASNHSVSTAARASQDEERNIAKAKPDQRPRD
jgi:hypothetical protein